MPRLGSRLPPFTTRYHLIPARCVAICAIVQSARCADTTSTRTRCQKRGPSVHPGAFVVLCIMPWRTASCHSEIPVAAISATSSGSASARSASRAGYADSPSTTARPARRRCPSSSTSWCPSARAETPPTWPTPRQPTAAATSGAATAAWPPSSASAPRSARASARGRPRWRSAKPREPFHGAQMASRHKCPCAIPNGALGRSETRIQAR